MALKQEQLKSIFEFENTNSKYMATIFTSPTDLGVIRNSGRSGARFAPEVICYNLGKLNIHNSDSNDKIQITCTTFKSEEVLNYKNSQELASNRIKNQLSSSDKYVHIGGGHDHIFPLLAAINKSDCDNIIILNIDAHCDTRISKNPNSGTPFRDFSKVCDKPTHLIQFGIHDFANSESTLSELKNMTSQICYFDHCIEDGNIKSALDSALSKIPFKLSKNTAFIFSLDSDAIDSSTMEGVSAVNPRGFTIHQVHDILDQFIQTECKQYFGIYEYNPIYDNLSQKGSRAIAGLIYKYLFK